MNIHAPAATLTGIGARLLRKEDARLMRGKGSYVSDIKMTGLMDVAFVRSPLAHARLRKIQSPEHLAGKVFRNEDLTGVQPMRALSGIPGFKPSDYPPLAKEKVRYVGEAIAMCLGRTRAEAEDVADAVALDLEELPPIADMLDAQKPGSPLVHEPWGDNFFLKTEVNGDIDCVAAKAAIVIRREYRMARQCMFPMEGKGVLAYWDNRDEQLVVYTSTQVPHLIRTGLAECLGLEQRQIRVIAPDVGGGFGYKCVLQPEEICVAWLALHRRHPVRWIEDRREHLVAGANARAHHYIVTAYADAQGILLGLDAEVTVDVGAYSVWPFTACLEAAQAGGNLPGPYIVPVYRCKTFSVATNKPPFCPYRAVARPGVCFAMELTIDAIARAVGREAADVRRDNLVPASAMPYTTITGKAYDSGDYPESLRAAVEAIDLPGVRARQRAGEPDGRLIGVGFATFTEQSAHGTKVFAAWGIPLVPGFEQATVRLTPDGGLEVRAGTKSIGQGLETTLAQVANQILGIPPDSINVILGDTALTPYSTGAYASRSMVMAGGAVSRSSRVLADRIIRIGAHLMQCRPDEARLEGGRVHGPNSDVSLREVAKIWYLRPEQLPDDVDIGGLEATIGYKPAVDSGAFSYATHAATVAVDPETGLVSILDYVVVEDCGTQVNPMIVEGQCYGGTAQGIGTALYEESPYDGAGQPLASTLLDYVLPSSTEVPNIRIFHTETPSPHTEHGIKGVGEGGAIAPPAAIINAINDALAHLGAELNATPATPHRILEALFAAEDRALEPAA